MENKPLNRIKVMLAERMVSNKDLAEMLGTLIPQHFDLTLFISS